MLVNAAKGLADLGLADLTAMHDVLLVPASSLAMARLGRPLPGAPMIAALAALAGVVSLDAVLTAISDRFTGQVAAGNAAAAVAAFDYVLAECNQLTVFKQIEGSRAVTEAVAMCRPLVICAYPITPQTHMVPKEA